MMVANYDEYKLVLPKMLLMIFSNMVEDTLMSLGSSTKTLTTTLALLIHFHYSEDMAYHVEIDWYGNK